MSWLLCCFVILQANVLQVLSKTGECNSNGCEFVCDLNHDCYYQICTERNATIKCSKGVIAVTSAFFGRTNASVCPHDNGTLTNCTANATLSETQNSNAMRYCNNDTSCSFKAGFDFRDDCGVDMWGNPCPGIAKYLTVNFTCVDKAENNLWTPWGPWSSCSKSCNEGNQTRWRNCTDVLEKKCAKTTCSNKGFSTESQVQNCNNFSCISSSAVMSSVTLQSTTYPLLSSTAVVSFQISSSFQVASSSLNLYFKSTNAISMIVSSTSSNIPFSSSNISSSIVHPTSKIHPSTSLLSSSSSIVLVPAKKTDDNCPRILSTWLIILIIIAIIVFLIWLFCLYYCKRKSEKKQSERRFAFTPSNVYNIPKKNEGIKNPSYEMEFISKAPNLMPIRLNIPTDDDQPDKTFQPPPNPGITRVYIGGKLVKEIGKDDVDKTIAVKMTSL